MAGSGGSAVPIAPIRVIGGDTGELWRGTEFQSDVVAITGTIAKEKREVRVPGTRVTGYKPGNTTRDGSFRYQKVDDSREIEFLQSVSLSLAEQRALRDVALAANPNADPLYNGFSLTIKLDDPQAYGASNMVLMGVQMWEMPIGFDLNELVTREIPITWESESIPQGFGIVRPS